MSVEKRTYDTKTVAACLLSYEDFLLLLTRPLVTFLFIVGCGDTWNEKTEKENNNLENAAGEYKSFFLSSSKFTVVLMCLFLFYESQTYGRLRLKLLLMKIKLTDDEIV